MSPVFRVRRDRAVVLEQPRTRWPPQAKLRVVRDGVRLDQPRRVLLDLSHGGRDLVHIGPRAQEHRLGEPHGHLAERSRWPGSVFFPDSWRHAPPRKSPGTRAIGACS